MKNFLDNARVLWLCWRHKHAKTPARDASPPPAPTTPGAGDTHPQKAAGPRAASPGTGPHHGHAKRDRLLTARFFADGCVVVWDARGHLTHTFTAGGGLDWDAWLQEITDDQR